MRCLSNSPASRPRSTALLRWTTASETNNAGFDVEHRTSGTNAFRTLGFAAGRGTTSEATGYTFSTDELAPGTHVFRLRQVDFDGAVEYSAEVELTVTPDGLVFTAHATPSGLAGRIATPTNEPVVLVVFDVLGRRVSQQQVAPGPFSVETPLASGVYVLRVTAGAQTATRSVVVMR